MAILLLKSNRVACASSSLQRGHPAHSEQLHRTAPLRHLRARTRVLADGDHRGGGRARSERSSWEWGQASMSMSLGIELNASNFWRFLFFCAPNSPFGCRGLPLRWGQPIGCRGYAGVQCSARVKCRAAPSPTSPAGTLDQCHPRPETLAPFPEMTKKCSGGGKRTRESERERDRERKRLLVRVATCAGVAPPRITTGYGNDVGRGALASSKVACRPGGSNQERQSDP